MPKIVLWVRRIKRRVLILKLLSKEIIILSSIMVLPSPIKRFPPFFINFLKVKPIASKVLAVSVPVF